MIILQANKIERSFSGDVLFDTISLQVDEGDRLALVGQNGAGKSTLLKILVGEEAPTSGTITQKRGLSVSYLAQDSRFVSSRSIYDEMLHVFDKLRETEKTLRTLELKMAEESGHAFDRLMMDYDKLSEEFRQGGGFTYENTIRAMLNGFKFDETMWDMKISELSGGQNTRLALAKMLLENPNLLVLDEPTNHLDIDSIEWLENYLLNYQGTLIIVSHDRYFLDKVSTITLDLTRHSLNRYVGNYSAFMALKAEQALQETKNFEKQQKEIAKLEEFVQRNIVRASTTKRAQSRRKQLDKMDRLDKPETQTKLANMTFRSGKTSGNVVLTVADVAIGHKGQVLTQPINLDVRKHDAIAIVGPNGIGKSTLLKSIMGQLPFIKGQSRFGANVEAGYYDQTQSSLMPTNSVLEEIWKDFPRLPELDVRNRLAAFLFSGDDVEKTVSMLSGGEKARLLLAKLSMENNNFLILDEPTNHLDIESKEVLENALNAFDGSLLFVSHDRYFINRVSTKILEISERGSTLYLGDYDYYLEKKAEQLAREAASQPILTKTPVSSSDGQSDYQAQKASQKAQRQLSRRLSEIEETIASIEHRQADINQTMLTTNEADQLMDLQKALDELDAQQESLMAEWEVLVEEIED